VRKIIVLSFITLDGVMQAPVGREEDTSSSFKYGGAGLRRIFTKLTNQLVNSWQNN
jgi:hypothetical protein